MNENSHTLTLLIPGYRVTLNYPRKWWQLWRRGWERHTDGLGRPCWMKKVER